MDNILIITVAIMRQITAKRLVFSPQKSHNKTTTNSISVSYPTHKSNFVHSRYRNKSPTPIYKASIKEYDTWKYYVFYL